MVIDRVAVVVLNWNSPSDTIRCVDSLRRQTYDEFTTVIVDNGSTDASVDTFVASFSLPNDRVRLLQNGSNLGFAGGVNEGIAWALKNGFDHIALLNNDAVADPGWLEALLLAAKKYRSAGIITSLMLSGDGEHIDTTGEMYSSWGLPFPRQRDEPASSAYDSGFVTGASGGASLYRASLFEKIGMFDDKFFAYYEDIDLSLRAQRSGKKIYYEKKAVVWHDRGSTSGRIKGLTTYQTFKNLPYVLIKNVPAKPLLRIAPKFMFAYFMMYCKAVVTLRGISSTKGLLVSLINFPIMLKKRSDIRGSSSIEAVDFSRLLHNDLPPTQYGLKKVRRFFTGRR